MLGREETHKLHIIASLDGNVVPIKKITKTHINLHLIEITRSLIEQLQGSRRSFESL